MPNWCECDLYVRGDDAEVRAFLDFLGEGFDFNKFVAYPEPFASMDAAAERWDAERATGAAQDHRPKDGFNSGGYQWCVANWGTKWNATQVARNPVADGEVEINFRTPWRPPRPVVLAASAKFPALEFDLRYFESGMGFNGAFECVGGQVERDERGDYFGTRGG